MIRIQKYLSEMGVCSRRTAEEWIRLGRVMLNGEIVTEMGVKIDPEKDKVFVDGKEIINKNENIYIAYNKPLGVTSTLEDKFAEITVPEAIEMKERLNIAGRLDKNTSGLMLLSNDGDFIFKVTHPSFESEKEYIGTTTKDIDTNKWEDMLNNGISFEGIYYRPAKGKLLGKRKFNLILKEGKKRQIRNMLRAIDSPVKTLKRIRIGDIVLGDLPEGKIRNLTKDEVEKIKKYRQNKIT